MAQGARFLNYEGELAVVVGERMKGVPIDDVLDYVGWLHLRERRRHARLPPRRPRRDAARQGSGRLPPARARARARGGVRPDRLHAAHVSERRGRAGGDGGRPALPGRLPARRPLPADHARAGRRRPHGHAGELAADGAGRRRRGRDLRDRAPRRTRSRSGTSTWPGRASRCRSRRRPSTSRSRSPRTRPSGWSPRAASRDRAPPASTTSASGSPTSTRRRRVAASSSGSSSGRATAGGRSSPATTSRTASSSSRRTSPGTTTRRSSCVATARSTTRARTSRTLGVAWEEREGSSSSPTPTAVSCR